MRSCAMRSTNLKGPEQTGLLPKLVGLACAALGDTIIPARSASTESSGENGALRFRRTVMSSTTSTVATGSNSPRRFEPAMFLWRSMLNLTAAASNFSPSWKVTPGRNFMVSALLSADHCQEVASCGTMLSFSSMSTSLSHSDAKTMRPTKVRASDGSSTSGSSARPIRRVWADAADAANASPNITSFLSIASFLSIKRCQAFSTSLLPPPRGEGWGGGSSTRAACGGGRRRSRRTKRRLQPNQPLVHRRAAGRHAGRRGDLFPEVAGHRVAGKLAQGRHFLRAALARIGAAGTEAAARGWSDRVGHVALNQHALAPQARLRHRYRRQQCLGVGMPGTGEQARLAG